MSVKCEAMMLNMRENRLDIELFLVPPTLASRMRKVLHCANRIPSSCGPAGVVGVRMMRSSLKTR
eukprot:12715035-Prorocentrum_lima.AAC.1